MVGNDVVDLSDPEAKPETLHPRFDERVFSQSERLALSASADPGRERWRLWAAKEAAFKLARKLDSRTCFSPSRFVAKRESERYAVALSGGARFQVRLVEEDCGVHAVALPEGVDLARVAHEMTSFAADAPDARDPEGPSRAVRRLACRRVGELIGVDPADLEVRKEGRIPKLFLAGEPLAFDLSLSHHGRLVAFAALPLVRDVFAGAAE
jgi:phosphopantetheinyl transferase (holo-ACP synthase)